MPGTVQQLIRWGEAVRGDHVHREGIIELLQPGSKSWACDVEKGWEAAARDIAVGIGLVPVSTHTSSPEEAQCAISQRVRRPAC